MTWFAGVFGGHGREKTWRGTLQHARARLARSVAGKADDFFFLFGAQHFDEVDARPGKDEVGRAGIDIAQVFAVTLAQIGDA